MNLTVLRYCQNEKIKPIYMLAEGDKFLLTAKLDREDAGIAAFNNHSHYTPHISGNYKVSGGAGGGGAGGSVIVSYGAGAPGGMLSGVGGAGGYGGSGGTGHVYDKNKEAGLYFMRVLMNKKPMWQYTYKGFHQKGYMYYEIDYETRLLNEKGMTGVIENKIFYKSTREEQLKNYMVLCE